MMRPTIFTRSSRLPRAGAAGGPMLAASLIAVLVFSFAGFSAVASEAPPDTFKLEDLVPTETLLFVKCSGVDKLMAQTRSLDLFKLWAEEEVQAFFADTKKMVHQMLAVGEGDFSLPVKEVWSLFQGEIAMAISSHMTIFEEGAALATAISVDMGGNREGFMQTLNGFLEKAAAQANLG